MRFKSTNTSLSSSYAHEPTRFKDRRPLHGVEVPAVVTVPSSQPGAATSGVLRKLFWFLILVLLGGVPSSLLGQSFGSISGTVADSTGAMIPSATVTAMQTQTGTTTVVRSNSSGEYVFPSLPPSAYSISAAVPGFESYLQKGIVLLANQSETVNIVLKLGQTSEVVTVAADAVQVDTTTGTLSSVVNQQSVVDLPLNGRNAAALMTQVGGVVTAPNDGTDKGVTKSFPEAIEVSANGSRSDQTNYMLDGGNNVDEYTMANGPFPFPDALQEFSMQTSNYSAEYGQSAGAVVNIVTKSGGSAYHGDLFEFVRNGMFNARNHFATLVDPLHRNQFGGTVGGPVKIPHLISGKHTFFFFGYQKNIIHDLQGGSSAYVPTQANLGGDFSALLSASNPNNPQNKVINILDPTTGKQFPGNIIPSGRLNSSSLLFAKDLPQSTTNGQVFYQSPLIQNFNEYLARGDHDFGTHDHMFVHYYYNDFRQQGSLNTSNLLTYADADHIRFQSSLISETHTFRDNLLNSLVVNYTHEVSARAPQSDTLDVSAFGVNIWLPTLKAIQSIAATGFFGVGDAPTAEFQRNNYTLGDDLHLVKGHHNFSFGPHIELTKDDINNLYQQPGLFTFNSTNTNYALASFDLGYLYSFIQGNGQYFNNRDTFQGYYAQDNWKMSNRFSLTYGIRYEPFHPYNEIYNRLEQFNPTAYATAKVSSVYVNAPPGLYFPGDPGMPTRGVNSVYTNVEPRIGFNLDIFGDGKTILRGGGGTFYDTRQPGILDSAASDVTPFSISELLTLPAGSFSNPYQGITNPFPAPTPPPKNTAFPLPVTVYTFNPSFHVPVTYDWNLTVEQELTKSMIARISYVGSHSSHLFTSVELNPAVYTAGSNVTTNLRRLYEPDYSSIIESNMGGNGRFQSMQLVLRQRMSHGLAFVANYQWSKALDNLPYQTNNSFAQTGQSYVYPVYMPNFKALDRGRSDFDTRQNLSASYEEQFPTLRTGPGVVRYILNGWSNTGLFQANTGLPYTVSVSSDISQTGILKDRAQQLVPNSQVYGSGACKSQPCVNWMIPSSFTLPATGTFGNVPKNTFSAPGYFDWDTALLRDFTITERYRFQFRAEYFNVVNKTDLGAPVSSLTAAGFGSITSSLNPRIAQFALKFLF